MKLQITNVKSVETGKTQGYKHNVSAMKYGNIMTKIKSRN
jgi:hypothetical protein